MISLRFQELANDTGGELLNMESAEISFRGVSIDSRSVDRDQLFVAIRGRTTDGHGYVNQAIAGGAAGLLVESSFVESGRLPENVATVAVPDSHQALLALSRNYLDRVNPKRVGITGSNGKTTTKEYAYQLVSAHEGQAYRSPGNLNNLYGLPLSLLSMPQQTSVALFELGISEPGEMKQLAKLLRPDVAVITNVSATHLEFLGSVEAVADEKLSMIDPVDDDVTLIVNADDELLLAKARAKTNRLVTFGLRVDADITPDKIDRSTGDTLVTINGSTFKINLFGDYQIQNLLAAYAMAATLDIRIDDTQARSIVFATAAMRGETVTVGKVRFISDCYNANPESVKAGLVSFQRSSSDGRKIVVLGDMLELGEDEARYHHDAVKQTMEGRFDLAVFVGPRFKESFDDLSVHGGDDKNVLHFPDAQSASEALAELLMPNDLVYLKGSRGLGLELVMDVLRQREEKR